MVVAAFVRLLGTARRAFKTWIVILTVEVERVVILVAMVGVGICVMETRRGFQPVFVQCVYCTFDLETEISIVLEPYPILCRQKCALEIGDRGCCFTYTLVDCPEIVRPRPIWHP
jgi:hypothetical protein